MEDTGASCRVLVVGELVEGGIGISLTLSGLLDHHRHESGERRCGCRGAVDLRQNATGHDQVRIVTRRRKGYVGKVALTILRNARHVLPGWLCIDLRDTPARRVQEGTAGHAAALVPGDLRNVADSRRIVDTAGRMPVMTGSFVELRPADCNVVRG